MNNPITAATIASIGAPAPAQTVTVTWANGTRANYSADMLDALKTDPAALDIQDDSTGEIIYIKPDSTEAATQAAEGTDEKKKVETMTRQKLYTAITAAGIVLHPCNAAETVPEGGDVIYYLTTKELTGIYADITEEREAAETRAAIKATQEAQEAPQEAPAAEAEQQPTTTEREALERINARQNAANLFTNITAADIAREIETMNDEQKEEEKPMSNTIERYDYMEHMTADVIDAIRERYTPDEIRERLDDDRDDFAQELNDDLWIDDSVTGNASGSYYCNAWRAEDAIAHNWDLIADMIDEFDAADILRRGPEAIDVSIRCYLLGQAIDAALDQLDDEIPEAEEPDEDDDTDDTEAADAISA